MRAPSLLERRVGLIKYHANHQAAHISISPSFFDVLDLVHVVAAITLLGDVTICLDNPYAEATYFDDLDRDGKRAAEELFPELTTDRLFLNFDIRTNTSLYWRVDRTKGLDTLLNGLPEDLGCWDADDPQNPESTTAYCCAAILREAQSPLSLFARSALW